MSKTVDEMVLDLLTKVNKKKEEIKQASKKPNWITSLTIGYNPESTADRVNIMVVKDPAKLIEVYSFLLAKEEYLVKAAAELGLPSDLTYMGYSIVDWKTDLKTRAAQLGVEQKKKELEAMDKRVNSLVSPEQRRAMELAALQAELGE